MEEVCVETVKRDFEDVCRQLNMDIQSKDKAWASYLTIRDYYTLEVRATTYWTV